MHTAMEVHMVICKTLLSTSQKHLEIGLEIVLLHKYSSSFISPPQIPPHAVLMCTTVPAESCRTSLRRACWPAVRDREHCFCLCLLSEPEILNEHLQLCQDEVSETKISELAAVNTVLKEHMLSLYGKFDKAW